MRWYGLALALVLSVVVGRVWFDARTQLETAQQRKGAERLDRLQWAMRAYLPGTSAPREAADAIQAFAETAEAAGKIEDALGAWRRLRGGILATRHLWSPFGDRLSHVNTRIADLTASLQSRSGAASIRGRDRATLVADHLALLQLDATPKAGWSVAVFLGFLGWVGGAAWTIRRGLTAEGTLRRASFLRGLAVTVLCFGVWIVGLLNA
ncbi:MAG: hypothetical protein ACI9U2_001749 [Bradymonadia bacterium]|jgi:hypothetical protein